MQNFLKPLRKARGITLDALSARTGFAKSTLNNFENGRTGASAELLGKVAAVLGVTIGTIVSGPGARDRPKRKAAGEADLAEIRENDSQIIEAIFDCPIVNRLVVGLTNEQLVQHIAEVPRDPSLSQNQKLGLMGLLSTELQRRQSPGVVRRRA